MYTDLGGAMKRSNENQASMEGNITSLGTNMAKIETMLTAFHSMACEQNKRQSYSSERPPDAKHARAVESTLPAL
jgi:hypothetical protein